MCGCKLKGVPLSNNYTSLCVGCVGSVHRCFSRQRVPACSCWVRMVLLLQGRSVFKSRSQDAQEQCRRNKETERWALIASSDIFNNSCMDEQSHKKSADGLTLNLQVRLSSGDRLTQESQAFRARCGRMFGSKTLEKWKNEDHGPGNYATTPL